MAKFAHADVLDGGLNVIKNGAIRMLLVSSYTVLDTFATVTTNTLATVTLAATDLLISSSGAARVLTTAAGKSAVVSASAGGAPDLHIVFTDNLSRILWATDETSNQPITINNTVNFPSLTYTSNQPV